MTMNGSPRTGDKVLNATWTFRGSELVVRNGRGERLRATLSFDAIAVPPAFHVTLDGERPLWMIWGRQGDELRVAFYDGIDRRLEDFGPRRKLVVLTLVPARDVPIPAAPDPCDVLRRAGADRLLGGPTRARPLPARPTMPGPGCALDRADGSSAISLALVVPPAGPGYVDAVRREAGAKGRVQIEDEPTRGAGAFSAARGWTVVVVALRRFAARALDAL